MASRRNDENKEPCGGKDDDQGLGWRKEEGRGVREKREGREEVGRSLCPEIVVTTAAPSRQKMV